MMLHMESNDNGFTNLWSTSQQLDCGTLYVNPNLADDLFFNKLTNITCINDEMIEKSIFIFKKNNSRPYLYSLNNENLDKILTKKGFILHDIQFALVKKNEKTVTKNHEKHQK